jgi:hypothetical protein
MKYDMKAVAQFSLVVIAASIVSMALPIVNSGVPVA